MIFIDEYTRYTFVYLMRTRDELYDKFEEFLADVRAVHDQSVERVSHLETDCDDDLVRLHSDNAAEYHETPKDPTEKVRSQDDFLTVSLSIAERNR